MSLRRNLALLLFFIPGFLAAEPDAPDAKASATVPPEALLSADTLLYYRFDGFEPHRKAADKTAYAEIMRGDLGGFLQHLGDVLQQQILPDMLGEPDPDDSSSLAELLPGAFDYFCQHGVVVGLEASAILPLPRVQLTVVFPGAGDGEDCETLASTLKALAQCAELEVQEVQVEGRTVTQLSLPLPVRVAWWQEGEHLVLIAGTEAVSHTLALARTDVKDHLRRMNLTQNPLFQTVKSFNKYETVSRGFFDCERALELVRDSLGSGWETGLDELGLSGLKYVTLYHGYEGKASRCTLAVRTSRERKGLLSLTSDVPCLYLAKLPPMPPDATDVHVVNVDWAKAYNVLFCAYQQLCPEGAAECQLAIDQMGELAGVDLCQEITEALGSTVVTYNSPSEGWQLLGLGLAVQVRDAAKLQNVLETLAGGLGGMVEGTDDGFWLKKRYYHNVPIYTLQKMAESEGMWVAPSYTIHNGWLMAGLYPQRVQGYILRATEDYPAWKPSSQLTAAMEAARGGGTRVLSLTESNPEPTVTFLLSLAPLLGGYLNVTAPDVFDPVMIPNAHNVARSLFPNVTLWLDDGETIRCESYASLALPFDLCSLAEWYGVACLASAAVDNDQVAGLLNGMFDCHCELSIPPVVQATYTAEPPPYQAPEPGLPGKPVPQPGESPVPFQPVPVPPPTPSTQFERIGIDFNSLWRLAANPPAPPMPVTSVQPLPPGPPMPTRLPPMPHPGSIVQPGMPAVPAMPPMPAMPGMPQQPAFRPQPVTSAAPSSPLTLKAYPVADLVGKEGQASQEAVLIRLVKMVEPNTWDEQGGFGAIDYFPLGNSLVIRQSPETHEKIDKFLKDLRENVAKQKK